MNRPTMESTSVTAGGRPETVAPNTTSRRPVSCAEQHRPGALHQGVDGDAQLGGAPVEAAHLLGAQQHVDLPDARSVALLAGVGAGVTPHQQGRLVDAGQLLAQARRSPRRPDATGGRGSRL
ncbi:hypothetical protein SGRIM128S_03160 [Streptomyces griseomycini]